MAATYEEYMAMAAKADAMGEEADAAELVRLAKAAREAAVQTPQGTSLVESFPQGGMIVRNEETGVESFTDGTYSTSDPSMIKMISAAGGDAAAVVKGQSAQEMIGELPTRILSAMKGMPFFRGYVEPVAGALSSAASQYYGDGVSPDQAQSLIREAIAGR